MQGAVEASSTFSRLDVQVSGTLWALAWVAAAGAVLGAAGGSPKVGSTVLGDVVGRRSLVWLGGGLLLVAFDAATAALWWPGDNWPVVLQAVGAVAAVAGGALAAGVVLAAARRVRGGYRTRRLWPVAAVPVAVVVAVVTSWFGVVVAGGVLSPLVSGVSGFLSVRLSEVAAGELPALGGAVLATWIAIGRRAAAPTPAPGYSGPERLPVWSNALLVALGFALTAAIVPDAAFSGLSLGSALQWVVMMVLWAASFGATGLVLLWPRPEQAGVPPVLRRVGLGILISAGGMAGGALAVPWRPPVAVYVAVNVLIGAGFAVVAVAVASEVRARHRRRAATGGGGGAITDGALWITPMTLG
jgi:hypothetical protein